MKSFRELRVWQAATNLVERIYLLTQRFPKQETYAWPIKFRGRQFLYRQTSPKGIRENILKNTFSIFQ
jgi:hypothetical protein